MSNAYFPRLCERGLATLMPPRHLRSRGGFRGFHQPTKSARSEPAARVAGGVPQPSTSGWIRWLSEKERSAFHRRPLRRPARRVVGSAVGCASALRRSLQQLRQPVVTRHMPSAIPDASMASRAASDDERIVFVRIVRPSCSTRGALCAFHHRWGAGYGLCIQMRLMNTVRLGS